MVMKFFTFYWTSIATHQKIQRTVNYVYQMIIALLSWWSFKSWGNKEAAPYMRALTLLKAAHSQGKVVSSSGRTSGMPLSNVPKITLAHHTYRFFFQVEKTSIFILDIPITETTLLLSTLIFDVPNTLFGNTWTNNIIEVYSILLLINRSKWE